jgi:16S rRNA (cytidine1402-2'-O)-methyltransferase
LSWTALGYGNTKAHPVKSSGILFVVATPIGNLDDISSRARSVLRDVTVIAAEDTRRTRGLLDHIGVSTPLVSLHEHNEPRRAAEIVQRLAAGESVALVSDAGTPLISDPGYRLVALARERGIAVVAVPGCCAAIAALSVAGLPTARFHFEGFLPVRQAARRARLQELRSCPDTLVFYEAVHRVGESLRDMAASLGPGRPAFVARELTKLHEAGYFGTLRSVLAALLADPGGDKGEFTIVVGGAPAASPEREELARVVAILAAELPAAQAATLAARLTGAARRDAYRLAMGQDEPGGS